MRNDKIQDKNLNQIRQEKRPSARGRPREFDRQAALCKALKLFWEQGFMQTSMHQLCEVMAIRSPSLYCAFGNKSELFIEALQYYRKKFWHPVFEKFMAEKNLYEATKNLLEETARILLMPEAPCGCLTVFSALTLPANEQDILKVISEMRQETRKFFRERLKMAANMGEIAEDTDIPAFTGALTNFFEGLTLQAREQDVCLSELLAIAMLGLRLLPPMRDVSDKAGYFLGKVD